jgi:prepilin-type N-terminal cleavage/methylation domain-containing protein
MNRFTVTGDNSMKTKPQRAPRARASGPVGAERRAFTLVELLVVVVLIAMLSSAVLFAMHGALDDAKGDRTKSQIARIDRYMADKWESYRTRQVRFAMPANQTPNPSYMALYRLHAIRELMRMELPDRKTDVMSNPVSPIAVSSTLRGYRRRCFLILGPDPGQPSQPDYAKWSTTHEGSECLYLILSGLNEEGTNAAADTLDVTEKGDTDGDGMLEVLDAWGRPIEYVRWAPAFVSDRQPYGIPTAALSTADDPLDPARVDPRWSSGMAAPGYNPFPLYPLIYSAGSDGLYEVNSGTIAYATTTPPNDPYAFMFPYVSGTEPAGVLLGGGAADNIHNHLLEVK